MSKTIRAQAAEPTRASHRLATLPMYDLPEVRTDTDQVWITLRDILVSQGLRNVPEDLDRSAKAIDAWSDPGLLLSQTCGFPYAHHLHGRVQLVATPCYDAPGCDGPFYRSWIISRDGDESSGLAGSRGKRLAINDPDSLSGCKAVEMMLPTGSTLESFFSGIVTSGAHVESIAFVARGDADIAAIDCVTWSLLARHRPASIEGVRIIDEGPTLPGLPLITAAGTSEVELRCLRESLAAAIEEKTLANSRRRLGLDGFAQVGAQCYLEILERLGRQRP